MLAANTHLSCSVGKIEWAGFCSFQRGLRGKKGFLINSCCFVNGLEGTNRWQIQHYSIFRSTLWCHQGMGMCQAGSCITCGVPTAGGGHPPTQLPHSYCTAASDTQGFWVNLVQTIPVWVFSPAEFGASLWALPVQPGTSTALNKSQFLH